ncbi:MAG: hypothetical protein BM485_11590 [Desulfobulbaceae bacterium DB1]|nr:MAG: hypothetical protein BM485_11590 [Desulfobulbaceae bacterium DB1]
MTFFLISPVDAVAWIGVDFSIMLKNGKKVDRFTANEDILFCKSKSISFYSREREYVIFLLAGGLHPGSIGFFRS